jgi:acyl dehydratase
MAAPVVGHSAERSRLVTARDIELFTELSGDDNPLRYNEELASGTSFGGIVVQGGVGSVVLNAVVAQDLPGPGSVFLELNLRFAAPIRPGDVNTGSAEVTSVRAEKPITGLKVRVTRDDGVVALEGNRSLLQRRPARRPRGRVSAPVARGCQSAVRRRQGR